MTNRLPESALRWPRKSFSSDIIFCMTSLKSAAAITFSRLRCSCVAVIERARLAHLDGSVQQFDAAKNIVFELVHIELLDGIVFGEFANMRSNLW